jgi:hypothetical protein
MLPMESNQAFYRHVRPFRPDRRGCGRRISGVFGPKRSVTSYMRGTPAQRTSSPDSRRQARVGAIRRPCIGWDRRRPAGSRRFPVRAHGDMPVGRPTASDRTCGPGARCGCRRACGSLWRSGVGRRDAIRAGWAGPGAPAGRASRSRRMTIRSSRLVCSASAASAEAPGPVSRQYRRSLPSTVSSRSTSTRSSSLSRSRAAYSVPAASCTRSADSRDTSLITAYPCRGPAASADRTRLSPTSTEEGKSSNAFRTIEVGEPAGSGGTRTSTSTGG